jgi:hypothetical protein
MAADQTRGRGAMQRSSLRFPSRPAAGLATPCTPWLQIAGVVDLRLGMGLQAIRLLSPSPSPSPYLLSAPASGRRRVPHVADTTASHCSHCSRCSATATATAHHDRKTVTAAGPLRPQVRSHPLSPPSTEPSIEPSPSAHRRRRSFHLPFRVPSTYPRGWNTSPL